ncbi:acetyl xylan esterase [Pholiota conissans]|uniref:Carboxylic ester hydrolase n=1 Tax=Pholiota conissans TaxID=109636 RepID=A0A9P6CXM3_9AGAR|nr:acetyl xylan esterase [Pholiota conissans]
MFRLLKSFRIALLSFTSVFAAQNSLQQGSNYGTNPTNVGMYVYRPTGLVANPALIVAVHYCSGTAQAYFSGTQYANLADTYKSFMVVYPNAPDSGGCWDVHTNATLTHNAGGDSLGIASMVRYAISNYGVNAARVYVTGTSSGGMMTNVLAGAYPDLFAAGVAYCGVPYACFSGPSMWNSQCAQGQLTKTPQQWGDLVRSGYPGYTGSRPKMQIWHGTADQTLNYNNFNEAIKEWTNVFGYSQTPVSTQSNSPISGWTRSTYGSNFQAISAQGVDHNIPIQHTDVLTWFGIIGGSTTTTSGRPTTTMTPAQPTTTNPGGATQAHYGQCGGYTGPTVCASPWTCKYSNDWYSQCL